MTEPTRITPIGLVGDAAGKTLNVRDFSLPQGAGRPVRPIVAILSVGTSMNAGKTLAATSLLHGLKAAGFRVAGIKATGTGSGGDLWIMRDAGADLVLDFTDVGFASTYLAPIAELEAATLRLIDHAALEGCDVVVVEIADGLQQQETAALMRSSALRRRTAGVIFSAYDAMGATYGVDTLRALKHRVVGLSGRLARSPLGVREAEAATGLQVYTPWELQAGALVDLVASMARPVTAATALQVDSQTMNGFGPAPSSPARQSAVPRPNASLALSRGVNGLDRGLCRDVLAITAAKVLAHEADAFAGAPRGARTSQRRARRSGYRRHNWATCFGEIVLPVPRFRKGRFRSALLLAPKASQDAVGTAIREAATTGRSGRLLKLLGSPPLPERSVQALAAEIARRYSASNWMAAARRADDSTFTELAFKTAWPADLDDDGADLIDPLVRDLDNDPLMKTG
jgi:Transposase, Mutator family